ncbi:MULTISPECIES: DnaD domain-containing protein [Bacillus cereus group]|uniref:DnaD domain protein n=1 Tax=Bacillus thuringiensis TaxID=1428 RepID=A0A1C4ARZ9_BACTU|nr:MULTISPECIES: DnaD domain protein [Bacillus cereus group]MED3024536.1 DnaD domain protein [Bacillus wiedmannii]OTY07163.1 hypothetical protein BK729_01320 [Bacillus thuringiensis serovar wratislaviensis]OUB54609.1 hypothetical protein BK743_25765 [Bacillus thuringiensis serovar sylvestriensis]SCB97337.1 DnaD domain protein [Bacillus thuringiensis]
MAVYRTVQVNFWQDDFVLDLTPEERYFYVYLLTCSKTTQCGIFPFPKRLAEMETGYNRETVDKLVQRFIDYGKILYDADTRELFVLNWLRYNPVTNTNVEKCVLRELKALQIAFENNKRTVAYVKGILRGWHGKGFTKVSEVEADTASFRKKDSSVSTGETEEFLARCEEWEKNAPSEEELQRFLAERGWRP